MQRLFSTFADGCPGIGILLLRLLTGAALIHFGIASRVEAPASGLVFPQSIGAIAGLLILIGLWTPMAGAVAALAKTWIAWSGYFSHSADPWLAAIQAVLGAALAMIGPGAWSIDARLYGRKHIDLPDS